MKMESCSVPPGFRFHPTEEELVGYYLKRKINSLKIELDVIIDLDLYKIEPWDIQERCKLGYEEQKEWYFFSHKDKKYPTGTRTNRATAAGFWKATGRDKAVVSKINKIVGMRKTLVFYKGRAPNGKKTEWIMHEYRIQTSENAPSQEEGWVVCRAFKKPTPTHRPGFEPWNHFNYLTNNIHLINPPPSNSSNLGNPTANYFQPFNSDQYQHISNQPFLDTDLLELPQLESPACAISTSHVTKNGAIISEDFEEERSKNGGQYCNVDVKNFENFFGSQDRYAIASVSHPNLDLMPQDFELEAHVSSFLGCFPN